MRAEIEVREREDDEIVEALNRYNLVKILIPSFLIFNISMKVYNEIAEQHKDCQ